MHPTNENRPPSLPRSLSFKAALVGTPLEEAAQYLRWLFGSARRHRHPELWELYLEEIRMPYVLQRLLRKDSCGVDVGSHVGSFLSLLIKYAPEGKHIAFEPSAVKSKWLRKKFPFVEVFPHAVADKAGSAVFGEDRKFPGFSRLLMKGELSAIGYVVAVKCLDDALIDRRIDLIKLDIEGGELAALKGAINTINKHQPSIIFECGSQYSVEMNNISRRELYDFIAIDMSYKIFGFSDFLFSKESMEYGEFHKCGLYPFRAFNFVALPASQVLAPPGSGRTGLDYKGL